MGGTLGRLRDRYYPPIHGIERFRDGTQPFYDWMCSDISPAGTVLNVGAGPTPEAGRRFVEGLGIW